MKNLRTVLKALDIFLSAAVLTYSFLKWTRR